MAMAVAMRLHLSHTARQLMRMLTLWESLAAAAVTMLMRAILAMIVIVIVTVIIASMMQLPLLHRYHSSSVIRAKAMLVTAPAVLMYSRV